MEDNKGQGKVLLCTTVAATVQGFNLPNIRLLQSLGYEVHVAANFRDRSITSDNEIKDFKKYLKTHDIIIYHVDFSRNAFSLKSHINSYRQIRDIIERNNYRFIHVQTPVAAAITRLAANKTRTKIIYTAHGFHFYKRAPARSWMIYYPVEKLLSKWTDILITINKEDFRRAKKQFNAKKIVYVPGVGVDLQKFGGVELSSEEKQKKRTESGCPANSIWLLSVGELNGNKNHETVIRAIASMDQGIKSSIYYTIAGAGEKKKQLEKLIKELGLYNHVKLLGIRTDVSELDQTADIYILPSYREGLNVSLMEAMACGMPCIVSRIRGNIDLIDHEGGALFIPSSVDECKEAILMMIELSSEERKKIGCHNRQKMQDFRIEEVQRRMKKIYQSFSMK